MSDPTLAERAQRVEATELTAIAAVARNGVIGRDNDMVWHIPEDWKRLKAMTMGGVLVMGRRTFAGLGRPLTGRDNFVVTRDPTYIADGIRVFGDVDSAIDAAVATGRRVWIFGGGQVYAAAMPRTTRLEITEVDQEPEGDARFPEIDPAVWVEVAREPHDGYAYVTFVRR